MSKTTSNPNVIKANELWGQWEKPTKDTVSSDTLSINTQNVRQVKLAVYKKIIDFYHQETNDRMFKKRWEELHDSKLAEIGLEKRLESGIKGKDSANAKYKENNWFGAMYTYAIAWGCLIPYHIDDLGDDDLKKKEVASLEAAIWSNIAACAMTANTTKENKLEKDQFPIVNHIGLSAIRICLGMKDLASVGIINKCCNRGITLASKPLNGADTVSEVELGKWKKQVEMLDGCDDKSLFKHVEQGKKVI